MLIIHITVSTSSVQLSFRLWVTFHGIHSLAILWSWQNKYQKVYPSSKIKFFHSGLLLPLCFTTLIRRKMELQYFTSIIGTGTMYPNTYLLPKDSPTLWSPLMWKSNQACSSFLKFFISWRKLVFKGRTYL